MIKTIAFLLFAQLLNAQAPSGYQTSANGLSGAALKTSLSTSLPMAIRTKDMQGSGRSINPQMQTEIMKMMALFWIFIQKDLHLLIHTTSPAPARFHHMCLNKFYILLLNIYGFKTLRISSKFSNSFIAFKISLSNPFVPKQLITLVFLYFRRL